MQRRTVVITGSAKGIGRAIALYFAERGDNIVLNDIGDEPSRLVSDITDMGVDCIYVKADISKLDGAETLIKTAKERFGAISVLVNNAGITRDALILRMSEKEFDDVLNVNLKGTFNTIRAASNIMLKQRSGSIVNIASVIGIMGNVGQANYAASKAGVIGLTKTCAKEFAMRGITCNAVAPGYIATDMTDKLADSIKDKMLNVIPLKRFGTPEDVAETVYFLSTAKYVTGQVVNVCGGMVV